MVTKQKVDITKTHKVQVTDGYTFSTEATEAYDCGDYYEIAFDFYVGRYPTINHEVLTRKFPKRTDNNYPVSKPKEKKDSEFSQFIAHIFTKESQ